MTDHRGKKPASACSGDLATILIVEDQSISRFIRFALKQSGYRVLSAAPSRARKILSEERVAVLITNTPLEFPAFGETPILYVASCPDASSIAGFQHALMLAKPFHPKALCEAVSRLVLAQLTVA